MNWKVKINKYAEEELVKLLKSKLLKNDDIYVIKQWISLVEIFGPYKLQGSSFWNDHALIRDLKWKNCRSSSFGHSGRIIYKIIDNEVIVEVVRITEKHDYK